MKKLLALFVCATVVLESGVLASGAFAQVQPPDRKRLFDEDRASAKRERSHETKSVLKSDASGTNDLDVKAPHVEFLKDKNELHGSGGMFVSGGGVRAQADEGNVNIDTKDISLLGNVVVNDSSGVVSADRARINTNTELGEFDNAAMTIEDGGYAVTSDKLIKETEFDYRLSNCIFSTCHCDDGTQPWRFAAQEGKITEEGYGKLGSTWLEFYNVPVLYTPYLVFPVKRERASGLLPINFGYSSRDGLKLDLPVFLVLDESTDATIAPFTETNTRYGARVDFRKSFSRMNNINTRWVYSDESARGTDLRGTRLDDVFVDNREFDKNRVGGFYSQIWRASPQSEIPISMVSDIHYIGDALFPREMDDDEILERQARYATSQSVLRGSFGAFSADIGAEYNQSIVSDQDLQLQRLPELNLRGLKSFRPFGSNPYGLKVVTKGKVNVVDFVRTTGYDGIRTDVNPQVSVPFHFANYLNNQFDFGVHKTFYSLDNQEVPKSTRLLDSSLDRTVLNFGFTSGSAVERVYDVESGGLLDTATSLGARNQDFKLTRVKHTIEPYVKYLLIPNAEHEGMPNFDSLDSIDEKSVGIYGFRSRLLGRFIPTTAAAGAIEELTPNVDDLPLFASNDPLDYYGEFGEDMRRSMSSGRRGDIRELVTFDMKQGYDFREARFDFEPDRGPFTDVYSSLGLYPTRSFALKGTTNYDPYNGAVDSWDVGMHLRDDRGDIIRARYGFTRNPDTTLLDVDQLQGNIELALTERLKFGAFSFFDMTESQFIENRVALRLKSACKCWALDFVYVDRINPDKQSYLINFTFGGLGSIPMNLYSRHPSTTAP